MILCLQTFQNIRVPTQALRDRRRMRRRGGEGRGWGEKEKAKSKVGQDEEEGEGREAIFPHRTFAFGLKG